MDNVQEIKQRLDIVDVISEYVRLKQMGGTWKALCPFHTEKSPSFIVSRQRQNWHCFGCGEGGDLFSFIEKIEGLEFIDALKLLAKKAGVELQQFDAKEASQRSRLLDLSELATKYWHHLLLNSPAAQTARDYLQRRGLTAETIESFRIGYAKDSWDDLGVFARSRGFTDEELFLAGLVVKKDRGAGFYDRFRDRIIFPINDIQGNPIGCSARTLRTDEAAGAKYINTPQTALYNKSAVVFNLDKAKLDIRRADLAVLVEGQMDVIASYQAGVKNVVAVSGTALTAEQVKLLKRYTTNLSIALDSDAAGKKAVTRSTDLIHDLSGGVTVGVDARGRITQYFDPAASVELNVSIITIPNGKDPDECIRNNPADWTAAIAAAQPVLEYFFAEAQRSYDVTSAQGKKQAAAFLLRVIGRLVNKVEQAHWIGKLAGMLSVPEQALWDTLAKTSSTSPSAPTASGTTPAAAPAPVPVVRNRVTLLTERLLALALWQPNLVPSVIEQVSPEMLPTSPVRDLYKQLISFYNETCHAELAEYSVSAFIASLSDQALRQLADRLILQAERDFFNFDTVALHAELTAVILQGKRVWLTNRLAELSEQIRVAEAAAQSEQSDALLAEFKALAAQLSALS
jgi:DNA primase